jgi:hypothetical protein
MFFRNLHRDLQLRRTGRMLRLLGSHLFSMFIGTHVGL